jgi:predicted glycosyltransferase involved in capsule biosynthesis
MRNLLDVVIAATSKPEVSVVVDHLHSISDEISSIIIIDFNEDKPSISNESINLIKEKTPLKYIFIKDQPYFNKSIALNIATCYSTAEILLFCDADILLEKKFIMDGCKKLSTSESVFLTPEYVVESDTQERRPAPGICMLHRNNFLTVNGYSSEYKGWGMEDIDFIQRLSNAGIDRSLLSSGIHLSHPNEVRTQHYHSNSIDEMRVKNRALFNKKVEEKMLSGTLSLDIANTKHREYIN